MFDAWHFQYAIDVVLWNMRVTRVYIYIYNKTYWFDLFVCVCVGV